MKRTWVGAAVAVVALLPGLANGQSDCDGSASDGPTRSLRRTMEVIQGIHVHQMRWCEEFDCDDFAYAFDEECHLRGIPCWQARMVRAGGAHIVNIVQYTPSYQSVNVHYMMVNYGTVIGRWAQTRGSSIRVPTFIREALNRDMGRTYARCSRVFADGNCDTGEKCFTEIPAICEEYRRLTGHDPSRYRH